jgi:hypothetical protein
VLRVRRRAACRDAGPSRDVVANSLEAAIAMDAAEKRTGVEALVAARERPYSELLEVPALCTCTLPMRLIADRCILAVACVTDGAVVVVPIRSRTAAKLEVSR